MKRAILRAAACGSAAWLIYGTVESVLSISIQLWRFREMEVLPWQWRFIGLLMGVYVTAGLLLGGIGGLLLRLAKLDRTPASNRVLASLTITLAFIVNLVSAWPPARSEYVALAVSFLLAGALAAALFSKRFEKLQFVASPWTASLLLLGAPWLSREALSGSALSKTLFSVFLLAAILAVAAIGNRVRRGRGAPVFAQAAFAVVLFGVFLTAAKVAAKQPGIPPGSPTKAGGTASPNILLITMDTVRADHTSVYGYQRDTTPNLREFTREATVYTRAIAASDFTLPTHAALFTGLYPNWSGALAVLDPRPGHLAEPIRPDAVTVAEILRARGYRTAEVAANLGFLGHWTGLTRGFSIADLRRPVTLSTAERPFYLRRAATRVLRPIVNIGPLERPALTAWDINASAENLLKEMKGKGEPFFLFLNYLDAHTPYVPDPPFDKRFPGLDGRLNPGEFHDLKLQVASGKRRLLPHQQAHLIAQYDGGIAEEDAAIAALFKRLRELGLYDNTLIVITSDHGDTFGEHGLMDHFLGFVYQELVHIPLLIKYPGQRTPNRSDDLVSQVDFVPTVLELVGVKPNAGLQGRSLLQPVPSSGPVVFSQGTRSGNVGIGNPRFAGLRRAIFSGPLKLIDWTSGSPELYDLASDPREEHNLYESDSPRATELAQQLRGWIAAMPPRKPSTKMDRSTIELLKGLGYVK
jgi:arylsulfatase A-like enzyme